MVKVYWKKSTNIEIKVYYEVGKHTSWPTLSNLFDIIIKSTLQWEMWAYKIKNDGC